jgi:DNA processing protein
VVALAHDATGRGALQAALDDAGLFAGRWRDLLPDPSASQATAARRSVAVWQRLDVRVALRGDPSWPDRLDRLAAPPAWFAWRGAEPLPGGRPAVAIVGARRATGYGTGVAAWLAEAAGAAGVTVVSGGAVGIDHAAHDAAADHGSTVVLGCGHDVPYPRPHAAAGGLFDRVLGGGGALVSELLPGTAPRPHHVRARNRIVAALVDAVVVVEGGPTSGSLVTAGEAADVGVDVLAVPGDVRAPGSAAPHRLLLEGAAPCTGPEDLLAALGAAAHGAGGADDGADAGHAAAPSVLPPAVAAVLAAAWPRPLRPDQVADRAGVGVGTVMAAVTRARVAGVVAASAEGIRLTRAPDAVQS